MKCKDCCHSRRCLSVHGRPILLCEIFDFKDCQKVASNCRYNGGENRKKTTTK